MDFLSLTNEDFLMIGLLVCGVVGSIVTILTFSESVKWGFIPLILFSGLAVLLFLGNLNGNHQWENKQKTYHPTGQVETVKYQDGSIEQYVYRHDGERINLTKLYDQFFEEGSQYREVNRNGYSWFVFNYDRLISYRLNGRIYEILPPE